MSPDLMRRVSAWILGTLLGISILVMFVAEPWINPSLCQAGIFALTFLWCVSLLYRPVRFRGSFALFPLAGAALWGLVQLATGHTVSRWETWNAAIQWACNLATFWLALQIGDDRKVRRGLLRGLVIFAFAISIISVLQYFSDPAEVLWFYPGYGSNFGPFVNRDRYAAFAELILPLALTEAVREDSVHGFYAVSAATLFAAVIAGASRAGSALVVIEAAALGVLGVGRRKMGNAVAVFVALACAFTAVVGIEALENRLADPDPFYGRREFLQSAIAMTAARPAMGFGLGNFENAYPAYAVIDMDKNVNHAHDDWAEWAVDGGLPFLSLMLVLAVWVAPKAVRSVWGIGILSLLIHATVDFPMQSPALNLWVFTLMGILAAQEPAQTTVPAPV